MKTKTSNATTTARTLAALNTNGTRLFRCESCDPESDAQRNLSGRTHYADANTLKYFKTRILNAGRAGNDLVFWLVESVNSRPDHGGYNKRAVAFDVFGAVITERDQWHRTTDQAEKALAAFLSMFDAAAHTRDELQARARRDIDTARRTLAALRPARKPAAH
jgi:hypothetical protein